MRIIHTNFCHFQYQGLRNYCRLCSINNAIGNFDASLVSVEEMDGTSDQLWSSMLENPSNGLTIAIEPLKDRGLFYSVEGLQAVLTCNRGYDMLQTHPAFIATMTPTEVVNSFRSPYIFSIHHTSSNI